MKAPWICGENLPCKFIEQCRLCSAKFESNANFAPQNHGDIVSGTKKREKKNKNTLSQISSDLFSTHHYFRDIYYPMTNFENKTILRDNTFNNKNHAYGRQRISWPMQIVGPIHFSRGCMIYLKIKFKNKFKKMGRLTRPRVHASTRRLHAWAMDALHPPPVFRAPRVGDGRSAPTPRF